jgi:hypothetical protein
MRNRKRSWIRNLIFKRAVLGFAVAALVVPAASQARVDGGMNGQLNSSGRTHVDKLGASGTLFPCVPACGREELILNSDVREYVDHFGGSAGPSNASSPQVVSSPGFDWGDAGIGASVAAAVVLLLGGAAAGAVRYLGKAQTT